MKIPFHKIAERLGMRHEKVIGHSTLAAKIIAGPETAARLGVPVGTEIDLGVISEGDMTITVEARNG